MQKMYDRYHGKWRKSLIFTQRTEKYRHDSLIATETWYETMVYPKNFRIDFGEPSEGNCVIFRDDSLYAFRQHKLKTSRADTNDLLYFLGGMYFSPSFTEVCNRFNSFHINPDKGYHRQWQGHKIFVLGAEKETDSVNQLWIEGPAFNVVRLITFEGGSMQDGVFSGHKEVGNAPCETLVTFSVDGDLRQKEVYRDCKANMQIPPAMFSVDSPWRWHWHR